MTTRDPMKELKPCPFCSWENIRIYEDELAPGHLLAGSKFMYALCKACGTRGPWAYCVEDTQKKNVDACIDRWNERDGVKDER